MIETIFYLQMIAFFIILIFAFWSRSWAFFSLAFVISITLGAQLAAGEPIEVYTGAFTMEENADENRWVAVPNFNEQTIDNSMPVNVWHYLLLYGGFLWLIVAFVLAVRDESIRGIFRHEGR